MRVQEKILIAKTQIKTEKIERFRSKIGKYLLLTLLIAYVYTEIEAIYAIIAEPNTFSITNPLLVEAQAETGNEASVFTNGMENPPLVGNIEDKIRKTFPECPDTMIAIARAESKLKTDAQNWNCYYNGKSTSCKPQDRHMAWSVDCGLFQINTIAKTCPQELFDVNNNINVAKEIKKSQGLKAWYTYRYAVENNLPI